MNSYLPLSLGVTSLDPPQVSNKEAFSSKTASIAASLDDALDDLLEETSTSLNPSVFIKTTGRKVCHPQHAKWKQVLSVR